VKERGIVTQTHGSHVDVQIAKGEACETCGCCVALGSGEMLLEGVVDRHGAHEGDMVEIEVPERAQLVANSLLFGVPVVALVLGYLAGYLLAGVLGTSPDLTGALVALGAVGLTFAWLRARGRDLLSGEADRPKVSAILPRMDQGAEPVDDGSSAPS
jgi:positive regulator of sigma E activity